MNFHRWKQSVIIKKDQKFKYIFTSKNLAYDQLDLYLSNQLQVNSIFPEPRHLEVKRFVK